MRYIFLAICLWFVLIHGFSQEIDLDSLEQQANTLSGEDKVKVLSELCWHYGPVDINKSEMYGREALHLALSLGDSLLIAYVYNDLGTVYYRKSEYDSAIVLYKISARIRDKAGKPDLVAASNSKIGAAYQELGKFHLSAEYQIKALKYFEESGDSIRMSQCYNNLARVYYDNHEYYKSIEYNNRALDIFREYNYTYGIATVSGSLALCYEMLGDLERAISEMEKALSLFRQINDKSNIATALLNLGHLNRQLKNNDKGIAYYTESLQYSKEADDMHTYGVTISNIANMLTEKGNYQKAISYYNEALDIARESGIKTLMHQAFRGLSELYEKQGKFDKALEFKQEQYNIRDSIYNIEKYEQISDLQARYETEKKEQAIKLLTAENQISSMQIKRQRNYILVAIVGFILLSLIGILWYNRKRLQQQAAMETEKNRYRKQLLNATVEATEIERKRIARELHDGIAQQLTGLKMAWQLIAGEKSRDESDTKLLEITKTLDHTADEVRNLSHQMMPRVLAEAGLVPALEDVLEKALKYSSVSWEFDHFSMDDRYGEKTELAIFRICQELINNSLKHSGGNKLSVQLFKNKNTIVLMVEDNGKGFNPELKKNGIGMMNIASRVDTVNGEISFDNSPEGGTLVTLRVPLEQVASTQSEML